MDRYSYYIGEVESCDNEANISNASYDCILREFTIVKYDVKLYEFSAYFMFGILDPKCLVFFIRKNRLRGSD